MFACRRRQISRASASGTKISPKPAMQKSAPCWNKAQISEERIDSGRAVSRVLSAPKTRGREPFVLSADTRNCSAWRNGSGPLRGFLFGLAPDGVFRALPVTRQAVSSYLAFSPLPRPCGRGGLFSVALSVGRLAPPSRVYLRLDAWRRDGVTRHRALWCSDFPPLILATRSDPPPDRNQG